MKIWSQGDELWQNKVKDDDTGYLGDGLADVTSITEYDLDALAQQDPVSGNTLFNFIDSQSEQIYYSTSQSEARNTLQLSCEWNFIISCSDASCKSNKKSWACSESRIR